ncbi:hypothetical protein EMCRGX_G011084 [Ephydatia muelleri]
MAALILRRNVLPAYWSASLVVSPFICRNTTSTPNYEKLIERSTKNKQIGRPLSPSLQHLAQHPDWVWILSFGHRASGIVTTGAISAAALLYLSASSSFPRIMDSVQAAGFSPTTITVAKFCMALPLCYHFFNGMRHLMWDSGRGFTMTTVVRAGLIALTCAILSAGGLALYTPVK